MSNPRSIDRFQSVNSTVEVVSVMVDSSLTSKEVAVKEENSFKRSRSGNGLSCHSQKVEKKAESKGDNPRIEAPHPNSYGKRLTGRSRGIGCIEDTLCRRMMIEDGSIQEDPLQGFIHTSPSWRIPHTILIIVSHQISFILFGDTLTITIQACRCGVTLASLPGILRIAWSWNTHPWMHADAWGRPMMPPSPGPCSNFP
ncbi:hypothetical protein IFM89_000245 [Coptis chinensis]|uniref:Uncharacterized protein n=1 Tax=Coptis chinensis TaxID=261450 RepID=A0A835M8Y0_9MAGN|nr:hypothetical protein IFM89_000245 [Coptis chinensis]